MTRLFHEDGLKKQLVSALEKSDFSPYFQEADRLQHLHKQEVVDIRAILEFSNYCKRACRYCGLNCHNTKAVRYRMEAKEIIAQSLKAAEAGYKTIVLQSGEDPYYTGEIVGEIVKEVKKSGILITLSCGERTFEDYEYWRDCGADRYLLKHETADSKIYESLHPCGTLEERIQCLRNLKKLGYETGSGFMIGLPGQTMETIGEDLLLLKEIGCHMAGIGPFIAHPETTLKDSPNGSTELTKRAVALARILLPEANLPATTSLGVLDCEEKNNLFSCGANVIMRKVTPDAYKEFYEIYPAPLGKTNLMEERKELEELIRSLGKIPR
ncbi:MAG: [FeFe] hydrogenase H-cluster radical SAM maturase HydE [Anaerovorax sp.]